MGFVGVYKAIYDYVPQSDGELALAEGNLLYVLSKDGDDGWWKAKKKAARDDDDEPEGLIPENYIEEAQPTHHARSLYEYTRQTDEELSFPEDAKLDIYDASDDDWVLAGYEGEYGFAPANYIDMDGAGAAAAAAAADDEPEAAEAAEAPRPVLPARQPVAHFEAEEDAPSPSLPPRIAATTTTAAAEPSSPSHGGAATALANVLAGRAAISSPREPTPPPSLPDRPRYLSDASEDEGLQSPPLPSRPWPAVTFDDGELSPALPQRNAPASHGAGRAISGGSSSNFNNSSSNGGAQNSGSGGGSGSGRAFDNEDEQYAQNALSPGAFHLYNISEMVSVLGKRKKMPTTLGINLKTGVILIAPERSQDGPSQEWPADRMTHYSREGKHVFMELKRPSKSVDFHAGAKDTAEEIVSALGELAGAAKAQGLREVILAGTGHELKKAVALYDFVAQGDDEVTVAVGDEVIVLDDASSSEWCQVRRVKNGKEGVIPSSYVEVTGTITSEIPRPVIMGTAAASPPSSPTTSRHHKTPKETPAISVAAATMGARSTVKQNRLAEEQLTRTAVRAAVRDESRPEVGPGVRLPQRRSSLYALNTADGGEQQRRNGDTRKEKSKPDLSKVRTWTDRSKSFSVEAQFLGLKDGKMNLHKLNGVKIAVPVAKMSIEDLEYVESVTGISLDEDKPLSSVKRKAEANAAAAGAKLGASVGASIKKPEYDWFQFFLSCDVTVGLCERYAQAMVRDNMDESVLPDIDSGNLRTLGLREGDIIKVMRFLDAKYGRGKRGGDGGEAGEGGLFSGPGGTLRNNTRRGRPTPATQTSDVVDAKAFSKANGGDGSALTSPTAASSSKAASAPPEGGFDDDAWDVKPSRQPAPEAKPAAAPAPAPAPAPAAPEPAPAPAAAKPPPPSLTGSMQELSLLTQPLPAEKLNPVPTPAITLPATATPAVSLPTLQQQQQQQQQQMPGATPGLFAGIAQQQTGALQPQATAAYARARPMAPQYTQGQGGLIPPPPPSRPLSAPQSAQPSVFGPPPIQPQMTGMTGMPGMMTGQVTGQVAPAGQSLNDISQMRMQQQYAQMQQQQAQLQQQQAQMQQALMPILSSLPQQQQPQPTGFGVPGSFMSQQPQSQFGQQLQMQPTGFGMQPQQTGMTINSMLPPALEPQRTAMPQQAQPQQAQPQQLQPQPTGHFTQGFGNHGMAPTLVAQPTGPAPPVRFGVTDDKKKLMPQPTGRRANLSAATPDNPFGF